MEEANGSNLNVPTLTRTDSLCFTVFVTVGFGDINATSQARPACWSRVFTTAVQSDRQRTNNESQVD
jgi:hypothetical protein